MAEPFIGQIVMFGGNFAPRGWAFCNGQLLAISSNQALFSILGTTYGGDGRTTFALPDLRGRFPMHEGQGPGLSNRQLGQKSGTETVALNVNEMPGHSHALKCNTARGNADNPQNAVPADADRDRIYSTSGPNADMSSQAIANIGGGQPHNNMPPFQVVNFIIALVGVFPSRN